MYDPAIRHNLPVHVGMYVGMCVGMYVCMCVGMYVGMSVGM